jgi:prophage DNA circulation protein
MSIKTEFDEIEEIVKRTTDNLKAFSGMQAGRPGAELRYAVGDLAARTNIYLADGTFANRLRICFRLATQAGINLDWMDRVIKQLTEETPTALTSTSVVQNSLIFALAQEGRIIAATTYRSRDDVDITMRRMKRWFDIIKDIIADTMSGPSYQAFINLTAAITRYLTDTARPLPRMLRYELAATMPGLFVSNYIYGEGGRAEELAAENKIVHPAFMQRTLRALSA